MNDAATTIDHARDLLRNTFGHEDFRDGQAEVVASAMAGKNLLVVMPTGSGKSLLYQLPALMTDGLTLVISPLIALMKDQVDELQRKGVAAALINSSLSPDEQREVIQRCLAGEIRLLYVAPERFRSSAFVRMLERVTLARLAVDEAHCISEWGHDFRPDYRRIKEFRRQMGDPVVTALTATATPRVQQDIIAALGLDPADVDVHVRGFDRPNLKLSVVRTRTDEAKIDFLRGFLRKQSGSGIIYVGTRRAAEDVSIALRSVEPSITMYHAGLESDDRAASQEAFLTGKARVAVATVAFGMGIDKADVRFVVHYHFPGSVEQYYQEIGRAGRDGEDSQCVLLYSSGDRFLREFFIDLSYPSPEQVESVMDVLYTIKANPVMLTYRQIAEQCSESVKDGQVGPSLRLLAGAGIARALEGTAAASVTLDRPGAEILPKLRGKIQKSVFESLAIAGDMETPGELEVNLDQLARAAGLAVPQVQRALTALDAAGHIGYHPPFRGRGVQKIMQLRPVFEQTAIDWETHQFLRSLEEEKLEAIESYIRGRGCRREFIVKYFGEATAPVCGDCDRCREQGKPTAPGGDGVLGRHPRIAAAVLVCIHNLRFPLGVGRVAQVITGSRDSKIIAWRLDGNPAYGAATCNQDTAKEVIDQLIAEGFITRTGEFDRPTLELTDAGVEAAEAIDPEDLRRPASQVDPVTPSAAAGQPMDVQQAALKCVDELPTPVGVGRVAEVLTGSHAKWIASSAADRLSVYGCIRRSQAEVKDVIRQLIADGLLAQNVRGRYPVLELTDAGRAALDDDTTPEAPPAEPTPQPVAEPPAEPGESSIQPAMQRCIEQVLTGSQSDAAGAVERLRLAHPIVLATTLADCYRSAADPRHKARAVWAAGQLCNAEAIDLLTTAAESPDDNVRNHAAKALGMIAGRICTAAIAINHQMPRVHQALQGLLDDSSDSVRQAAHDTVTRLTQQGS